MIATTNDAKYKGSIQTEKSFNDAAETELAFEAFEFNGHTIHLPHPLDDDGYRNPDYVSIETKAGYSVWVYHDRIEMCSPEGWTVVSESFQDLASKCAIADKLAAVNRWK